eukprot:2983074-Pyramimonas_sp.AAC.1
MEALRLCDIGGANKRAIQEWLDRTALDEMDENHISKTDIEDAVDFIRIEKCHDAASTKILFSMKAWNMRKVVLNSLRCEGKAKVHTGVMPAGWLEEELSTWVQALSR